MVVNHFQDVECNLNAGSGGHHTASTTTPASSPPPNHKPLPKLKIKLGGTPAVE